MPTDRAQDTEAIRAARKLLREYEGDGPNLADRVRHREVLGGLVAERDRLVARLEAAERIRKLVIEAHDQYCGCNRPGNPAACVAEPVLGEAAALAAAAPGETDQTP